MTYQAVPGASRGRHISQESTSPRLTLSSFFPHHQISLYGSQKSSGKPSTMTTYIPSLTIPSAVFEHPAASILLPVALGTAIGYSTRRMYLHNKRMR